MHISGIYAISRLETTMLVYNT